MKEGLRAIRRIMRVKDRPGAQRHGERHRAAGNSLRKAHDVGRHARLFAGGECAGAAKAGHDLVGNEQGAGLAADLPQGAQNLRGIGQHAARAQQQRLDDQRGDIARSAGLAQSIQRVLLASRMGERQAHDVEQQRFVGGIEHAARARRHRADRVTMIGVLQRDDAGARFARVAPEAERHFQRDFDGGRAAVGIEDMGEIAADARKQA